MIPAAPRCSASSRAYGSAEPYSTATRSARTPASFPVTSRTTHRTSSSGRTHARCWSPSPEPPQLRAERTPLNRTGVGQILTEEGFGRLPRGPAPEASTSPATAGRDTRLPRAAVIDFAAFPARAETSLAGLLLALPDLVSLPCGGHWLTGSRAAATTT